jgi:anti-sigma regulatory factor (Ser/Thr protein kinase)
MELQRADWTLAPEAQSSARARRLIAQRLVDVPEEQVDVVLLLTGELVANAVRHGDGPVGLHVAWGGGDVRVEVDDQSPELPAVRPVDEDALNGRGLQLVDGLCSSWGVTPAGVGKSVWFSLHD